ncbi:hypothetical protein QO207_28010 [Pseudomonas sp. CAN2814]|uniref:hypothetical protein n=1 Tax=Pseudomonas sp. CAN1 TaxID=3046726 RepID=UPI002648CEA5|nr:hypothetical protein [Pseudomonas sp. CAN1]MDN6860454.1 hypothetical protein [Pseudomonas sp. CAN1]
MAFKIGSIKWPGSSPAALSRYLEVLIVSVDMLGIDFGDSEFDPIQLAKEYIRGDITKEQLNSAADFWWVKINDEDGLRNLQGHDALMARIALCFLSIKSSDPEFLNESLSWYLQVLERSGLDVDYSIDLMALYFKAD